MNANAGTARHPAQGVPGAPEGNRAAVPARNAVAKRKKKPAARPVPERTCVACRTKRPQRHLVSFVRTADGRVELDRTGRKPGRGAYLCPAQTCWRLARARRSLEQALKVQALTPEQWAEFEIYMQGLPETLHQ